MSVTNGELTLDVVHRDNVSFLRVSAATPLALADFEGGAASSGSRTLLEGPLSMANAGAVRKHVPWLRPAPIGLATSVGVGDRLGLATAGHAAAFAKYGFGVIPVFAQQSIREMNRLGRSPQQVIDDATFGCVEFGWSSAVGADADHLQTIEGLQRCIDAGFTSFTLDPGLEVKTVPESYHEGDLSRLPWGDLDDDAGSFLRRYSGLVVDLENERLAVGRQEIIRAALKYAAAVVHVTAMYRHLVANIDRAFEVEIAVDETVEATTYVEHIYLANELKRLGLSWNGFAPRYIGDFEKGVEYIGDTDVLYHSLKQHSQIARALGPYKLSLHSGSDKFGIYQLAVEATERMVHLKTSGTSYLTALGVAAGAAPALFREIYSVSLDAYVKARSSYQVSANLSTLPQLSEIPDSGLVRILENRTARQVLHVGYGDVLTKRDNHGEQVLAWQLRNVLTDHRLDYNSALELHIGRHLQPFAERAS